MTPAGTVVFAVPNDDMAQSDAMCYISKMGLTRDNARMTAMKDGMLIVTLTKDTDIPSEGNKHSPADQA